MKAQVISINLNASKASRGGKTLTGIEFVYQGEPYKGKAKEPTTRFVFTDSPIAPALQTLNPGDWVNIEFDATQWKNPLSCVKIPAPTEGAQSAPKDAGYRGTPSLGSSGTDDLKDVRIARSVALKAATEIMGTMIGSEMFKKSMKPDAVIAEIKAISADFEKYLLATEDVSELESTVEGLGTSTDFDDVPFE